ncbi:hypothetical protein TR13x_04245 [Caloranaerobacter sp. TR13]|uniref:class I SAM-dependent methyltransferase n=1 Tax=Caloranaerobacter sp. TR13 TaxID=1302151 RepID=UPI0006D41EEF|nr:class I SAM-dependent methyltransferase [Caloranaerobacter sp. TR13]KPU27736.1 hypothetical protein TR13x_04245 [Caloranaerobacter sp. TR13]
MPTSYHGQISLILDFVLHEKPNSILDIGIGFGKYGVLLRELLDISKERYEKKYWKIRIDGIEGYEHYSNPIYNYVYDNIIIGDVRKVIKNIKNIYDIALLIDVLEHFEKEEGKQVLYDILKICKVLIISVPAIPADQTYLDNDLEIHKSVWLPKDFQDYKVKKVDIVPMTIMNSSIVVMIEGCD